MGLLLLFGTPYHEELLQQAERLVQAGHREAAVVVSQMAAEIRTEQVFTALLARRGMPEFGEVFLSLLPNYNLGNERVRGVFDTLSSDHVGQQPLLASL